MNSKLEWNTTRFNLTPFSLIHIQFEVVFLSKKGQKGSKRAKFGFRGFKRLCLLIEWFFFKFKTREEYHKLLSDNIFIEIWLNWGALCIKKGPKRVKKGSILCFEASRGFVCCYRKIFSSQNWWRTTEKFISHLFHWYITKIRCPIDWKQGLESPIWPFFMLFNLILIKYDTFYSSDINVMGVKFIIVMSLIIYDFKIFFLNNKQSL